MLALFRQCQSSFTTKFLPSFHHHHHPIRSLSSDAFDRLNIYKDPEKAPKQLELEQYPKWLWTLLDPQPSRDELYRQAQKLYDHGGYDAVLDNMKEKDLIRLFRLSARLRIKTNNAMRKGGRVI